MHVYVPTYPSTPSTWPLHDIAITNIVWCMAHKRGVGGRSCVSQSDCSSIAIVWALLVGGGNTRMLDSYTKALT